MNNMTWKQIGVGLLAAAAVASPNVGHAAGRMTSGQAALLFRSCKTAAETIGTIMWCAVVDREGKTLLIKATDTGEAPSASMVTDAWRASIEIALGKAYTAVSVSSDRDALTSADVGRFASETPLQDPNSLFGIGNTNLYRALTGNASLAPDDSMNQNHHGIVTFGGGIPIYSCDSFSPHYHKLLGAIGVNRFPVQSRGVLVSHASPYGCLRSAAVV